MTPAKPDSGLNPDELSSGRASLRATMNTMPDSLPLAGQVALITGANTGIGRVIARELAQIGRAHV